MKNKDIYAEMLTIISEKGAVGPQKCLERACEFLHHMMLAHYLTALEMKVAGDYESEIKSVFAKVERSVLKHLAEEKAKTASKSNLVLLKKGIL